jgi:hypothetical protein
MRLLLKLSLVVLSLNTVLLGGTVGQRLWRPTRLGTDMFTNETCDPDCWFGVQLGQTAWRDARDELTRAGAEQVTYQNQKMNTPLPISDTLHNKGNIQVLFAEGVAQQVCFFTQHYSIAEVIATFGKPDYFWMDETSLRYMYSRLTYEEEGFIINFYMIYDKGQTVVKGTLQRPFDYEGIALPMSTPISEICQPSDLEFNSLEWMPAWNGFRQDLADYTLTPPFEVYPDTYAPTDSFIP